MNIEVLARIFKCLGDPTRLAIYEHLRHQPEGSSVTEVAEAVIPEGDSTSKVSFHLKELRSAGLIDMKRSGKRMICTASPTASEMAVDFFTKD